MPRLVVLSRAGFRPAVMVGLAVLALLFVSSGPGAADPVLYPADRSGWVPQVLDERDTAPYLSFHKAQAYRAFDRAKSAAKATGNQDSYDARYYDLDLNLNPTTQILIGIAKARVQVVTGPLTTLDLDLYNIMTVSSVTSGGVPATFTHAADVLTINLDRAYATGELIEVVVNYSGDPQSGGSFGWNSHNGQPMIWTLSEAFGARSWWPCKDWPEDKADSVQVRMVTPSGLIAVSNGTSRQMTDNGTNAIAVWFEKYPITTYLVSLAIHPYTVTTDYYHYSPTDSMEIKFYDYPDHAVSNWDVNQKVSTMLGTFAGIFGEYPFVDEKYGEAEFPWGGGMEHQTCTSLGAYYENIVAHELSHQWWGDMITCRDFHHVWINEGFATYSEALWSEANGGSTAYQEDLSFNKYFGSGTIYVPDLSDWGRIFNGNLSYNKASWVLHMLRGVLGDADFFASLRAFYTQYKYSVATTENFRDVCEGVSGRDLDWFFQEWIYGEYYPAYMYNYSVTPAAGGYDIGLTVRQTQSWQIFRMPIDVTVTTASGEHAFVVDNSLATQAFTLHVTEPPLSVKLDKDEWILRPAIQDPLINPPFDRGVLLVNGLDWTFYGSEVTNAYAAKAFWGDYTIDFWDTFDAPVAGYPATLPAPQGHGTPTGDLLGRYRHVIWVSDNTNGDLADWSASPIAQYLEAGGNVLLMTRQGEQFLSGYLGQYLGTSFYTPTGTITDCISTYTGLTNMAKLSLQTTVATFNLTLTQPESTLLFKADAGFTPDRGIGAWRKPAAGGIHRSGGAQLVFLSGRPYRWNYANLKANVMFILGTLFREPLNPAATEEQTALPAVLRLDPLRPNPTDGAAVLRFSLPRAEDVRLDLLDVTGRRVRSLASGMMSAGSHAVSWDGRDSEGRLVPAGVYWARIEETGGERISQKITVVR
jgi:aminopeptidase N